MVASEGIQVLCDNIQGDPIQFSYKIFAENGAVYVENGFFAVSAVFYKTADTFKGRACPAITADDMIGIVFHCDLQKLRDVMKMIIKCVPVHLAAVHNVFHGNFVIRLFFQ